MRLAALLGAITLLATVPFQAGDEVHRNRPRDQDLQRLRTGAMSPEPGPTPVNPGDPAPDFSYIDVEGRWARFRAVRGQGAVLLVFSPDEAALRRLEAEREALLSAGVIPVAVVEAPGRAVRGLVERLGVRFPVVPDARAIVAAQFNCIDPVTARALPAWFVIDRAGQVRALHRGGWPAHRWSRVAADALGIPATDAPRPARTR